MPTYPDYAEHAFALMALAGLVFTQAEILDRTDRALAARHPANHIAEARKMIENQIASWGNRS